MICPACGSEKVITTMSKKRIKEKYSDGEYVGIVQHTCEICKSKGDFLNINESVIRMAIERQLKSAYNNIIDDGIREEYSLSAIERILGIEQGQLAEWRDKTPTTEAVVLMQIIKKFPGILDYMEFWRI